LYEEHERIVNSLAFVFSRRSSLVATAFGAVALLLTAWIEFALVFVVFISGVAVLIPISVLHVEGAIDPQELWLEYNGRTVSLADIRAIRAVTIGPLALCWLSVERGTAGTLRPRFVVMTADAYGVARDVFEEAIDRPVEPGRAAPRTERVVFLLVGLGLLAIGPALWVLVPATPAARWIVGYAGLLFGFVGVIVIWHALIE
jgi:hypothetical protein